MRGNGGEPADLGLSDTRQLSFAFHTLTLTPAGEDRSLPGGDTGGENAAPALVTADA